MATLVSGLGGPAGYGEEQLEPGFRSYGNFDVSAVFENDFVANGSVYESGRLGVSVDGGVSLGSSHIYPFGDNLITYVDESLRGTGQVWIDVDPVADKVTVTWDRAEIWYRQGLISFQLELADLGADGLGITFRYGDSNLAAMTRVTTLISGFGTRIDTNLGDLANVSDFGTYVGNTGKPGIWEWVLSIGPTFGTAGDDTLLGTKKEDVITGLAGNDTLRGLADDDSLSGGEGNDEMFGGTGRDTLEGEAGDDLLKGGDGSDTLNGGEGNDQLLGGTGNDSLTDDAGDDLLNGGDGSDRLDGGDGNDQLFGGTGNDTLYGGAGDDLLNGGDGNDRLVGWNGVDKYQGGEGHDIADLGRELAGVTIDLAAQFRNAGAALGERFVNVEEIKGTAHDDLLLGDGLANVLIGGAGRDVLDGAGGADEIFGGRGDDLVFANPDDATLSGGEGFDTLRFDSFSTNVELRMGASEFDLDGTGISGFEYFIGTDESDYLIATRADFSVVLEGGRGKDRLRGGSEDDTLRGGNGKDWLYGNSGDDLLIGGAGPDDFVYNRGKRHDGPTGNDTIADFDTATDRLSIRTGDIQGVAGFAGDVRDLYDDYAVVTGSGIRLLFTTDNSIELLGVTDIEAAIAATVLI